MNLLLGLILGALLTIGTAFIADAFSTSEVTIGNLHQADRELGRGERAASRNLLFDSDRLEPAQE